MNNRKQIVIRDFYEKYDDACDVKYRRYRLDYKTYRKVLKVYFKYIKLALIEGEHVQFNHGLGHLLISCYTKNSTKDMKGNDTRKEVHPILGRLRPLVLWYRKDSKFRYKFYWRFNINSRFRKQRLDAVAKRPELLNKYAKH